MTPYELVHAYIDNDPRQDAVNQEDALEALEELAKSVKEAERLRYDLVELGNWVQEASVRIAKGPPVRG